MKRFITSIIFTIITATFISQNLVIKNPANVTLNSSTVTVAVSSATDLASVNYNVLNTATNTANVKVKRVENSIVPGSLNYFCWAGNCYSSQTSVSPFFATISSNQTSPFIGDYDPDGNPGTSTVTYIFFDVNTPTDSAFVTVIYSTQVAGIKRNSANNMSFHVFPNPGTDFITIVNDNLIFNKTEVIIYDENGTKIHSSMLTTSKEKIDIKNLPSGRYHVLISDGKHFFTQAFIKN